MSDCLLTYDEVEDILATHDCDTTASELHGMLCGLYAAGLTNNKIQAWRVTILPHLEEAHEMPPAALAMIDQLFQQTGLILTKDIFSLELLLPAEDYPLIDRLTGLSGWCQGFLLAYGIQLGNAQLKNAELDEALKDLADIAQVELDVEEDDEMESAYFTVHEHVRVASQVVWIETLALLKQIKAGQNPNTSSSIH